MLKKKLKIVLIMLLAILISLGIARLGVYGHQYKLLANLIFGFVVTLLFFDSNRRWFFILILPSVLLSIIIHFYINDFVFYQLAVPSSLSFFIGIGLGMLFLRSKMLKLFSITVFFTLIAMSGLIYDYWLHKLNYDTYFGNASIAISESLTLLDENEQEIIMPTNKPLALYFWNNNCAICIKSFPKISVLEEKYNKKINFYLINVLDDKLSKESQIKRALTLMSNNGANTKNAFYNDSNNSLSESYPVYAFPTILIIENNEIIYVGGLLNFESKIKSLVLKN